MIICCLGDSLTEGDYGIFGKTGIANVQPKGYPFFLEQLSGSEVRNYGKCGYRPTHYLNYYLSGAVNIQDADLVVVMLGTNGGMNATVDSADNRAYRDLIQHCQEGASKAKIMLCTPPHATSNPDMANFGYAPQVEEAVKYIHKLAERWDMPLIDVANCPDFGDETEKIMQPNDGLHFGELGYQTLAEYIWKEIKELCSHGGMCFD